MDIGETLLLFRETATFWLLLDELDCMDYDQHQLQKLHFCWAFEISYC
ncbi:hypothetical protein QUA58_28170 [Microcoleus sp. N9_A1]|jgi:hypothetical protein